MSAIRTHELTKRYGSFTALKGIDLEVGTGEVFGFLGPNGAGKSTTIRILLDEIRATLGTAHIFGLDSRRDAVAIHRRLGYLPSDLALYPKLTGAQTLRFFGRLRGGVDAAHGLLGDRTIWTVTPSAAAGSGRTDHARRRHRGGEGVQYR